MQTVKQTVEIIAYVTGEERGRVNQIARALLDAGILPKSVGRNIKKVSGFEVLPLLAAVAMADKVQDAARIAAEFAALPMEGESGNLADFFGTVLVKDSPWGSPQIEFAQTANGPTTMVTGHFVDRDGETKQFSLPFWRDRSWGHFCKRSFTISGEGIEALRGHLVGAASRRRAVAERR